MNAVESFFIEQMENDLFQSVAHDDFSFADPLIDQREINRITGEEIETNACDD